MGRVAFDPGEMLSLAGQLTSSAASLLGVQGQVLGAANDPGLLPSGMALAAEAEAAVAGLVGVQTSMVNTAQQITTTTATYEAAMAAEGALPPVERFLQSPTGMALPFLFNPIMAPYAAAYLAYKYELGPMESLINQLNGMYGVLGGFTVDRMNEIATQARESHSPLWPWMQAAHNFLGNSTVRLILNAYSTASSAFALGLGWAAFGVEMAGGGAWDLPADGLSLLLSGTSAAFSAQNLEVNALLAAGGDQTPQVKQSIGSDEVSVATFGVSRYVKAISGVDDLAPEAKADLTGVSDALKAFSRAKLTLGTVSFITKHVPEALAQDKAVAATVVHGDQAVASAAQTAWNAQQHLVGTGVQRVKSEYEKLSDWLREHPGVIPNPNPVPLPHGSH